MTRVILTMLPPKSSVFLLVLFFGVYVVVFPQLTSSRPVFAQGGGAVEMYEGYFHLNATTEPETNESFLYMYPVYNDALFQLYCYLSPNSSNKIKLFVDDENELLEAPGASTWNVTHIPMEVGQEINVTVTNGVVRHPPSDVPSFFSLYVLRENVTDEVWGHYVITRIDVGWQPVPALTLIPTLLAFFLLAKSYRKVKRR